MIGFDFRVIWAGNMIERTDKTAGREKRKRWRKQNAKHIDSVKPGFYNGMDKKADVLEGNIAFFN